eukprot:6142880-Amphidinium_carterae.1
MENMDEANKRISWGKSECKSVEHVRNAISKDTWMMLYDLATQAAQLAPSDRNDTFVFLKFNFPMSI